MGKILKKGNKTIEIIGYSRAIREIDRAIIKNTGTLSDFKHQKDKNLLKQIRESNIKTIALLQKLKKRIMED